MHPLDRLRETRLLPIIIGLALVAAALALFRVAHILTPFIWASVTAYLLHPLVARIERHLRLPRPLAIVIVWVGIIALLIFGGVKFAPTLYEQVRQLTKSLPNLIDTAQQELLREPRLVIGGLTIDTAEINNQIEEITKTLATRFGREAPSLVLHTVGFFIHLLVYVLATYYFLLQGDRFIARLQSLLPKRHHDTVKRMTGQVNATFGAYIRAQVILFVIMSVATFILLTVLQVQYALALGIATGALELIPVIGPWTAAIIAMTVAISQGTTPFGWTPVQLAAVVGIGYLVLRMLEDHFVIPQLVGRIVRLHPLMVIFGVLTGASVGGALGLLLAVPILAALKIIVLTIIEELRHPPARRVVALQDREELPPFLARLGEYDRQHVVLLLAPGIFDWDNLSVVQELAAEALHRDIRLEVVTPDKIAGSIATAAGITVITQSRLDDDAGFKADRAAEARREAEARAEQEIRQRTSQLGMSAATDDAHGD